MKIVEIDGVEFCLGLSWYTADGPGVKKDISDTVKSEGYTHGSILVTDTSSETEINFIDQLTGVKKGQVWQLGATDDDEADKAVGLAHLFAAMTPYSGVYCISVSASEKWVLVVNEKQIVENTDVLVGDDEARDIVAEYAEAIVSTHSDDTPVVVITDSEEILDLCSDLPDNLKELVIDLKEAMISGLLVGDYDSLLKKSYVKKLEGSNGLFLLAALLLIGGGYYGYKYYQGNLEAQRRLQEQADRLIQQREESGPSHKEILESALNEEKQWLYDEMNSTSSSSMISSAVNRVMSLPMYANGWSPVSLVITGSRATVKWEATTGTPLGFKEFAKKYEWSPSFDSKGETATISLPSNVTKNIPAIEPLEVMGTSKDRMWLIDHLKNSPYSAKLGNPEAVTRKESISGIKDPALARQAQLKHTKTEFYVSGEGTTNMHSLASLLNEKNAINIERITVNLIKDNWEIKGFYYDK